MENTRILVVNPERYTTEIAIYHGNKMLFLKTIRHPKDVVDKYEHVTDQYEYRANLIVQELSNAEIRTEQIEVVMGRGGLVNPIPSGIYEVNEHLKHDLIHSEVGEHAINLGGLIADYLAKKFEHAKAFIADPVVVDELTDLARYTGLPWLKQKSVFHALNHKTIGRRHAKAVQKNYEDMNLIVAHLGEGISIGAHEKGRVIDVNQTFDGGGAFSLERAGSLPEGDLVQMCFSGNYTKEQILKLLRSEGGMKAYCGTTDINAIEKKITEGDKDTQKAFDAMAYQVSKYIGFMSPVLKCKVDAILLTGEIAHSKYFVDKVIERVGGIAPVHIYPGENVVESLAQKALMYLKGELTPQKYR